MQDLERNSAFYKQPQANCLYQISLVYVFEPHLHHYHIPTETLWFQTLASSVESQIIETH